jgi:hypothetical protein
MRDLDKGRIHNEMSSSVNYIFPSLIETAFPFTKDNVVFMLIMLKNAENLCSFENKICSVH